MCTTGLIALGLDHLHCGCMQDCALNNNNNNNASICKAHSVSKHTESSEAQAVARWGGWREWSV